MFAAPSCPARICALIFAWWLVAINPGAAGEADGLPTVGFAFQASAPEGIQVISTGEPIFFDSVHRRGGTVGTGSDGTWRVASDAPFGEGALDFALDRTRLSGDLALVLRADWDPTSDVAVQLFDASDHALALDLFGNPAQNGVAVGTDTFIVPLSRYPLATRITVRRLSGPLTVHAAGLFPVLSEMPTPLKTQRAIARQLGLVFLPGDADQKRKTDAAGKRTESPEGIFGTVHTTPALEHTNQIAADALAQTGYPAFRRTSEGALQSEAMAASGSTSEFVKAAMRSLAIESRSVLNPPFFTSSDGVAACLLSGEYCFGVMSVPLTSAEKERFFARNGFPVLEFEVAHDAIEVLVNSANPLREITIPQLDAIYSDAPRAGASQPMRTWNELSVGAGTIHAYGGALSWGTARSFQEMVLKGGAFRSDVTATDVVFRRGVEARVAADSAAIGYATLRPRQADVRALAVAPNSGEKAWPVDAPSVYSGHYPLQRKMYGYVARKTLDDATPLERELVNLLLSGTGQTMVATSGSLPLSASETAAGRSALALPR